MSAADLELRKTLTDAVEDEMRIHANPLELQLHLSEGLEAYPHLSSQFQNYGNIGYDTHLSDEDYSKESSIFNKYADPNLTTTEKKLNNGPIVKQVNLNLTPVQPTISLNTITPNPFLPARSSFNSGANGNANRNGNYNQLRFDFQTRINRDSGFEDDIYDEGYGDFDKIYEEDEKLNGQPLWDDSNVSGYYWTNDQETLSRFDQEFDFDDDISDEEEEEEDDEEEEEDVDDEAREAVDDRVFGSRSLQSLNDQDFKVQSDIEDMDRPNEESLFMDTQRTNDNSNNRESVNELIPEQRAMEHEQNGNNDNDDDGMFSEDDEDPLYEPALLGSRRKPSMVVSQPIAVKQQTNINSLKNFNTKMDFSTRSSVASSKQSYANEHTVTRHRGQHSRVRSLDSTKTNYQNLTDQHVCLITNPVTKEPCSKKFSRPYDLIRHQKTIHASKKKIFRCLICIQELGSEGYQRTFSRNDALSRHVKVKHNLQGGEAQRVIQYAKDNVEYQTS